MTDSRFTLETFVDFVDDSTLTPVTITPAHVDSFMAALAKQGFRRVLWGYYGDGHGGWLVPAGIEQLFTQGAVEAHHTYDAHWGNDLRSRLALGNNPMRAAAEAAHRHGLELYGYYKPYETGASMVFHEGSPEGLEWGRLPQIGGYNAWMDPFVLRHPELRLKRRTDDLWPGHESAVIHTIRLTKSDAAPTRLRKENIQLWASPLNYGYTRKTVAFDFKETVEPSPCDVRDTYGTLFTKKGDPVRVLTLSGLNLTDKYIAVSADTGGAKPDFANVWDRLLTCYDPRGRQVPGTNSAGGAVWFPELERFPETGLIFDTGFGTQMLALESPQTATDFVVAADHTSLFKATPRNIRGVVAFARGRNLYASGALCETEPAVQDFWLSCITEMLDAGVDGVDFRVENHSCHSIAPEDYGFNPAVMAKLGNRRMDDPELLTEMTRVRTQAYTDFLRRAKALIASRGKRMRINLNVDWFRPPEERESWRKIAYPANIEFDWRTWVDEGLLDEGVLRMFVTAFDSLFTTDRTVKEMVARCQAKGVPVTFSRYVWENPQTLEEFQRVRADGRFSGFIFYQTWAFMSLHAEGWDFASPPRDAARKGPNWPKRAELARQVRAACASIQ